MTYFFYCQFKPENKKNTISINEKSDGSLKAEKKDSEKLMEDMTSDNSHSPDRKQNTALDGENLKKGFFAPWPWSQGVACGQQTGKLEMVLDQN